MADDGHVRIPNNIMDALITIRVPGQAMQVLLFVIRKTIGWNKKVDKISLSQIQTATNLPKHKIGLIMPSRNTRMVCCRRCKHPNFIYEDGPNFCEVCGKDLLTDGIDWGFDSEEDEEHSGTCTNQGRASGEK